MEFTENTEVPGFYLNVRMTKSAKEVLLEEGNYYPTNYKLIQHIANLENIRRKKAEKACVKNGNKLPRNYKRSSLGVEVAIVLGYICSEDEYYRKHHLLRNFKECDGDFFYKTLKAMEEDTGLDAKKQNRAIMVLNELSDEFVGKDMITVHYGDIPRKRYISIDKNVLREMLRQL